MDYSGNIKQGDYYFDQQDFPNALKYYTLAKQENPDSYTTLLKIANTHMAYHQADQALPYYQELKQNNQPIKDIDLKLALAHLNSGNIQMAKEIFWNLNQANPQDFQVRYYQALILLIANDFEQAKEVFEELKKDEVPAEFKDKAKIYLEAFDFFDYFQEGEAIYLKTLMAKAMVDTGEFNIALASLQEIITTKPDYHDAWVLSGYCYIKINKAAEAIDSLNQARALNPDNPLVDFYQGLANYSLNNLPEAAKYLQNALKKDLKESNEANKYLADIYLQQNEYSKASVIYENLLTQTQPNIEIYEKLVSIYLTKTNNLDRAEFLANTSLQNFPNSAVSNALMGAVYYHKESLQNAKKYLEQSLQIDSNLDIANLYIGMLYESINSNDLAENHYLAAYKNSQDSGTKELAAEKYNKLKQKE
ncbi:MAG: tetratricopeptide repeat protein [Ignavibacteriae bacterium]|nr:tetratricopeptide repeat protein [Ignavibacteriota bacterium]